ncbi:MAG: purine-nucleoside phosphorylase, partial [Proteobacteria bacterium]|nr:purine-nucleoside phosphorylase [Pseudomonadota bacterium]
AYDEQLRQQLLLAAKQTNIHLHQGVYAWMSGPQFETPAEIKAIRLLGVDAVGMSTVPETILARHQHMKVLAVSVITNYGAGMEEGPLSHDQTFEFAAKAADDFKQLMIAFIKQY